MKHQPYENWILEDIELTDEQFNTLEAHLETCTECQELQQSLDAAITFLKEAPAVKPAPGFTSRGVNSLEERKALQQSLLVRRMFLFLAAAMVAILGMLLGFSLLTTSPVTILVTGIRAAAELFTSFLQVKTVTIAFVNALPPAVSIFFWVAATGTLSMLSLTWVATMWRISTRGVSTK
jgi:hypothetical protein